MNKNDLKDYLFSNRNILDEIKKMNWKRMITYCCIFFSFILVNLFMSFLVNFEASAKVFSIIWILIFMIVIYITKFKKSIYLILYYFFFVCSLIQYFHIAIMQKPFSFSQLLYTKEGMTYINSIISNINILIVLYFIFGIINSIICFKLIKRYLNTNGNFVVVKKVVLLLVFIPLLLAAKNTAASTFNVGGNPSNKLFATFSRKQIYETFNDKMEALRITGVFEYSLREPYLYIKKRISQDRKKDIEIVSNYFKENNHAYEKHDYTGIFKDKNVIFIMAESIDDWLITEDTMPTVYNMKQNSIDFINRYAPFYGAGRTLNTEYCLNTGLYVPVDYNIYTSENNDFRYSLPSMFNKNNYVTNSIHFNNGNFYDRVNMHKAYGYDNSYFLFDMYKKNYMNDLDITSNDELYNLMISKDNKFLTFFITYSVHLPYAKSNKLCNNTSNGEECIKKLARYTDDAIKVLIEKLKRDNLLDDTVIVFATDHYAYGYNSKEVEKIKGGNDNIHLDKVPFFIWNNDKYATTIDKYVDTQDILPTVLNLFGIEYENIYIGTDALSSNHNNYVYFSDSTYTGDIDNVNIKDITNEIDINELIIDLDYYNN